MSSSKKGFSTAFYSLFEAEKIIIDGYLFENFLKSFQCVITDNITLEFEFYKWILWKNLNNPFTYQAWNWLCQDLLCLKIFAQRITLSKWYLNLNKMVIYKPLKMIYRILDHIVISLLFQEKKWQKIGLLFKVWYLKSER